MRQQVVVVVVLVAIITVRSESRLVGTGAFEDGGKHTTPNHKRKRKREKQSYRTNKSQTVS